MNVVVSAEGATIAETVLCFVAIVVTSALLEDGLRAQQAEDGVAGRSTSAEALRFPRSQQRPGACPRAAVLGTFPVCKRRAWRLTVRAASIPPVTAAGPRQLSVLGFVLFRRPSPRDSNASSLN